MIHTYPERRKYNYIINTTKWPLGIKLMQATANETKDFNELLTSIWQWEILDNVDKIKQLNKYYINLIKSGMKWGKWYEFKQNIKKMQVRLLVKWELDSYIDEVIEYIHIVRKSVYLDTKSPKINWKSPRSSIFPNDKEAIYKKTWIPTNKIYDVLTMEQVWRYLDKIVFEYYENFDEWKAVNDKLIIKTKGTWLNDWDKSDLEFILSQKR